MYEVNSGNVGGGELDQEVNNSEDMLNLQQAGINISFGKLFKILVIVQFFALWQGRLNLVTNDCIL